MHPLEAAQRQSERAAVDAARLRGAFEDGTVRQVIRENAAAARKAYQEWRDDGRTGGDSIENIPATEGSA